MIHVEVGTRSPHQIVGGQIESVPGPSVVSAEIPDNLTFTPEGVDGKVLAVALAQGTHLPDNEALINMLHRDGWYAASASGPAEWVWSDNPEFERIVADYFGCAQGRPDNVEDEYWTRSGPPGVS